MKIKFHTEEQWDIRDGAKTVLACHMKSSCGNLNALTVAICARNVAIRGSTDAAKCAIASHSGRHSGRRTWRLRDCQRGQW